MGLGWPLENWLRSPWKEALLGLLPLPFGSLLSQGAEGGALPLKCEYALLEEEASDHTFVFADEAADPEMEEKLEGAGEEAAVA